MVRPRKNNTRPVPCPRLLFASVYADEPCTIAQICAGLAIVVTLYRILVLGPHARCRAALSSPLDVGAVPIRIARSRAERFTTTTSEYGIRDVRITQGGACHD